MSAELGFYHLSEAPLERVLPVMLAKSLERGWRVELRGRDPALLAALDQTLWSGEGFFPHGQAGGAQDHRQPVLLTAGPAEDASSRPALFLVDRAAFDPGEAAARVRTVLLFDGHDAAALEEARAHWRATVSAGLRAVYWAQEGGRWTRKAQSGG